jgi:hypothetical protein
MKYEQYENKHNLASKRHKPEALQGEELALQNGIGLNSHWNS